MVEGVGSERLRSHKDRGKEELRLEEEKLVLSFLWNMMRKIERIGRIEHKAQCTPTQSVPRLKREWLVG